jgi:hypothetical protein
MYAMHETGLLWGLSPPTAIKLLFYCVYYVSLPFCSVHSFTVFYCVLLLLSYCCMLYVVCSVLDQYLFHMYHAVKSYFLHKT